MKSLLFVFNNEKAEKNLSNLSYNYRLKLLRRCNIAFKSYSWSIGTISFRVSQLNYKIERQLQLLKEFWK